MNLFGSILSSKHIVIVHNLVSIFPAAKLFTFKKCAKVIRALTEKYTITLGTHKYRYQTMGQHSTALNWSSFSITLQKILPCIHHPGIIITHLEETFLKICLKSRQIGCRKQLCENYILEKPSNWCTTSRYDALVKFIFFRSIVSDEQFIKEKSKQKKTNKDKINCLFFSCHIRVLQ